MGKLAIGIVESGTLKGRKIIIDDRSVLPENLYWVSKGDFLNGSPRFALFCLNCEIEVPGTCPQCNKLKSLRSKQ